MFIRLFPGENSPPAAHVHVTGLKAHLVKSLEFWGVFSDANIVTRCRKEGCEECDRGE